METTRQNKIARLIQKELGIIFQSEARSHFQGSMITVTRVQVTRDLAIARVYLSLFATSDKQELFGRINERNKEVRTALAVKIRNQVRVIPALEFHLDDSLDYIENIENLLKQ